MWCMQGPQGRTQTRAHPRRGATWKGCRPSMTPSASCFVTLRCDSSPSLTAPHCARAHEFMRLLHSRSCGTWPPPLTSGAVRACCLATSMSVHRDAVDVRRVDVAARSHRGAGLTHREECAASLLQPLYTAEARAEAKALSDGRHLAVGVLPASSSGSGALPKIRTRLRTRSDLPALGTASKRQRLGNSGGVQALVWPRLMCGLDDEEVQVLCHAKSAAHRRRARCACRAQSHRRGRSAPPPPSLLRSGTSYVSPHCVIPAAGLAPLDRHVA